MTIFFGYKMKVRDKRHDEDILNEELNPEKNIYRIPPDAKLVVDIGAHIGGTSIRCARNGSNVLAFEPEKSNYETLCHNVKINELENRIKCINLGVGTRGDKKLFLHPKISGTNSCLLNQKGLDKNNYQIASFITIKEVFKNYNIENCDLLKMDCEGGEIDIIRDIDDELASKIKQISLEFHSKKTINELIGILSRWYFPTNTKKHEWVFKKL